MINAKLFKFEELMLWNFIQCLLNNDLSKLKKSIGFIKQSKLKRHWDDIFSQYMDQSGDNSQVFMLGALKEYSIIANRIKVIDQSVSILAQGWNDTAAHNLKLCGYTLRNVNDRAKYIKSLKSIQSQAKQLVMRANKIKNEIDSFNDNSGSKKGGEIKESDFNQTLLIMSKNQGYSITSKTITLIDFIELTKLYKEDGK